MKDLRSILMQQPWCTLWEDLFLFDSTEQRKGRGKVVLIAVSALGVGARVGYWLDELCICVEPTGPSTVKRLQGQLSAEWQWKNNSCQFVRVVSSLQQLQTAVAEAVRKVASFCSASGKVAVNHELPLETWEVEILRECGLQISAEESPDTPQGVAKVKAPGRPVRGAAERSKQPDDVRKARQELNLPNVTLDEAFDALIKAAQTLGMVVDKKVGLPVLLQQVKQRAIGRANELCIPKASRRWLLAHLLDAISAVNPSAA